MDDFPPYLTAAEYFAGIGLVRMGLEPMGWRVVWANDISAKKYELYQDFFPQSDHHYVIGDIFEIGPATVPQTTLATCSFPCIDLSLAGNMNGIGGDHSSAFWGFINVLENQGQAAPPLVLIENVPGWLHSNNGADFRVTIQALNQLGYACDVFTLDALRFTPQSRLRVMVVGTKFPFAHKNPQLIFHRPASLLSNRLRKSIFANLDLDWFYNDLPEPPPLHTSGLATIVEAMADTDERWWSEAEVKRHLDMMEETHYQRVSSLHTNGETAYRTFFRRRRKGQQRAEVRRDELAGCLRTAVGGSGKQFLIKVADHKVKMRAMTPREYARLQGVPDEYPIKINGVQALTGFGDAVCVPVITWIAENVLNPLVKKHLQLTQQYNG
ncbi:MAG: DNA (cytosine-5-)-methyltransferase [Anaerolineae bacterium]|nr:DNA (cytosine-5-)-methyltransferase [Anaerolineae bacterium]MCB0226530.1 DNA (cytosine-5-)-methyltransferase [Anaerolineae bacterium]